MSIAEWKNYENLATLTKHRGKLKDQKMVPRRKELLDRRKQYKNSVGEADVATVQPQLARPARRARQVTEHFYQNPAQGGMDAKNHLTAKQLEDECAQAAEAQQEAGLEDDWRRELRADADIEAMTSILIQFFPQDFVPGSAEAMLNQEQRRGRFRSAAHSDSLIRPAERIIKHIRMRVTLPFDFTAVEVVLQINRVQEADIVRSGRSSRATRRQARTRPRARASWRWTRSKSSRPAINSASKKIAPGFACEGLILAWKIKTLSMNALLGVGGPHPEENLNV